MNKPLQDNDPLIFLLDGALLENRERKRELVLRMAADLVRYDAAGSEADAIRSLFGRGYTMSDIAMLVPDARRMVDDARQVAFQQTVDVVAKEVGKP